MSEEAKRPQEAAEETAAPAEETQAPVEETAESKAAAKDKKEPFGKKAKEIESLKGKLDTAEKTAAAAKDQLMRTAAEYDNFRKRSAREAEQKFNDGVSFAVNQILPILDTLEMAANAPTTDEAYKKGVIMTLDKAAQALEKMNITEIEAMGQPFDPNVMNAVSQMPAPEGIESGCVMTVYQKGYRIGDRVIRHATVIVAE